MAPSIIKNRDGGVNGVPITNEENDRISKRSLVCIKNRDLLCFATALDVGTAKMQCFRHLSTKKVATGRYQTMRDGDKKSKNSLQKRTAFQTKLGLPQV